MFLEVYLDVPLFTNTMQVKRYKGKTMRNSVFYIIEKLQTTVRIHVLSFNIIWHDSNVL